MPEHVHLVILPAEPDYSISSILTTLKRPVARKAIAFVRKEAPEYLSKMTVSGANGRKTARFWQRGGGYDRNLWSPGYVWQMIDYVHENPVRRKLCAASADWRWSSAATYEDERKGPLPIDFASLPNDPR